MIQSSGRKSSVLFIGLVLLFVAGLSVAFADQKDDEDYTAKTKEYTAEEFFLTELVDHLPASDTVPTPEQVLGHVIGAPDILHGTSEIFKYLKAVADASPRVTIFFIGKGHVVLFSINPMWRHETIGSYSLIFNTALNFGYLDAGRAKPKKETESDQSSVSSNK